MYKKAVDYFYLYALESALGYYKTQKMCDKVVDSYSSAIQSIPECFKTQKLCDKTADVSLHRH